MNYRQLTYASVAASTAFETLLNLRQYAALRPRTIPPKLAKIATQAEFDTSQAYGRDRLAVTLVHSVVSVAISVYLIHIDFFATVWTAADALLGTVAPSWQGSEIAQSLAFLLLNTPLEWLEELPFDIYRTFVVAERYGFNKSSVATYVKDFFISNTLQIVLGFPVYAAFIKILLWAGPAFPIYALAFLLVVLMVMLTIYPIFIQPLFNRFDPLPDGPVRKEVEALAAQIDYPLTKLFVVDGSKRSAHSNAYMYGFYKNKRIVLFDTLLEHSTPMQVKAVVAHELGHWALSHPLKSMGLGALNMLALLYAMSVLIFDPELYTQFGFGKQMPLFLGCLMASRMVAVAFRTLTFLQHYLSRVFEFQADAFAVDLGLGEELKDSLTALLKKNASINNKDPWYSAYNDSHPPLIQRLEHMEELLRKKK